MASTKIINVARNDNFEDVFDLVRLTDATDLILIFPKTGSKFSKQKSYFTILKKESDQLDKNLSVMTEDKNIVEFAEMAGLTVLGDAKKSTTKTSRNTKNIQTDDALREVAQESEGSFRINAAQSAKPIRPIEDDEEDIQNQARFAGYKTSNRRMEDIVPETPEKTIHIKSEISRAIPIHIKKEDAAEDFFHRKDQSLEDVDEVWERHQEKTKPAKLKSFFNLTKKEQGFKHDSRWSFKHYLVVIVPIIIVAFGIVYFVLGSAEVTLKVRRENINFSLDVYTSPRVAGVDKMANKIPGQKFVISKDVSQSFPTTTEKNIAQKARGKIKLFNNSINQSQRLVATTRFETTDGNIFRIPQTILVPGAIKSSDGKVQPGTYEAEVFADRPGPEYNIGPASFKLPGLKGLPQYNQISAISEQAMSGGFIGTAKVISEEDFAKAQTAVENVFKKEITEGIKDKIQELMIADGSIVITVNKPTSNATADEAAEQLKMTVHGTAEVVAFRKADLDALIEEYINRKTNLSLAHGDIKVSFQDIVYTKESEQLNFKATVSGNAGARINEKDVLNDILGRSIKSLDSYFASIKDIQSVRIATSPFWVRSIPKDMQKVRLTVE